MDISKIFPKIFYAPDVGLSSGGSPAGKSFFSATVNDFKSELIRLGIQENNAKRYAKGIVELRNRKEIKSESDLYNYFCKRISQNGNLASVFIDSFPFSKENKKVYSPEEKIVPPVQKIDNILIYNPLVDKIHVDYENPRVSNNENEIVLLKTLDAAIKHLPGLEEILKSTNKRIRLYIVYNPLQISRTVLKKIDQDAHHAKSKFKKGRDFTLSSHKRDKSVAATSFIGAGDRFDPKKANDVKHLICLSSKLFNSLGDFIFFTFNQVAMSTLADKEIPRAKKHYFEPCKIVSLKREACEQAITAMKKCFNDLSTSTEELDRTLYARINKEEILNESEELLRNLKKREVESN